MLTDNFTQLVFSPKNLDLKVYKTLTDKIIETNFEIINQFSDDVLLKYLTGTEILKDYTKSFVLPIKKIKSYLRKLNFEGSIITSKNIITLYEKL